VWTHDYFEGRVEEECARAARGGRPFTVLRVDVPATRGPGSIEAVFSEALRQPDVLALYAQNSFEALLVDVDNAQASGIIERIEQRFAKQSLTVRTGRACYPGDGCSPEALIAHACAVVRGQPIEAAPAVVTGGKSEGMRRLSELLSQVAPSTLPVLILGETGVGKELCAERLHRMSPRADRTFLRLNCAALAESLLESQLFGHEKGAFTGATTAKRGLLESADGGTVFLDEVGELTPSTQVKLLRVLDERKVLPVGSVKARTVDVRFVAATNRNLEAAIARGLFRQDLYFRLAGATLWIPALRERIDEIVPLALRFIEKAAADLGLDHVPELSLAVRPALERYHWPGNVRELRNMMERAVLLCRGRTIEQAHLPIEKMDAAFLPTAPPVAVSDGDFSSHEEEPTHHGKDGIADADAEVLRERLKELDKRKIIDALERCAGNQTRAAQLLGISRGTLIKRLAAYNISRPRNR
jgi:transcriptional regulator with PAS, ATPase and Fis domain